MFASRQQIEKGELFPKVEISPEDLIEKSAGVHDSKQSWREMAGLDDRFNRNNDLTLSLLKDSGYAQLPMTDRALEIIQEVVRKGGRPVTLFTGKLMVDKGIPEVAPAFPKAGALEVGDTVIPLQFVPMGVHGAKFDLPYVTQTQKVKKIFTAVVTVTKNSYPVGMVPSDLSKVDTVREERIVALSFENNMFEKQGFPGEEEEEDVYGEDVEGEEEEEGEEEVAAPMPVTEETFLVGLPRGKPSGETTDSRTPSSIG